MANVLGELFQDIADAIRSKTGSTDTLKPNQFPEAIEGITTGGGGSSADERVKYVTFVYEENGETKEHSYPVIKGDTCHDPAALGLINPTKASTVQYNYTFYGWGASDGGAADANILKNITEDKTVYAIFTATARLYTITWLDEDGTELPGQKQWAYGTVPSYTPTKDGVAFNGWTPTPVAVTGDASYTAMWVDAIAGGACGDNHTWKITGDYVLTISGTGDMPDYAYDGGYGTNAPWAKYITQIKKLVVEDGVTSIGNYTIGNEKNLTSVLTSIVIPNSVTRIGDRAFRYCTALKSITIPSSVTSIERYALLGCSALTSATFENASGWYVTKTKGATSGTNVAVTNKSTAAQYLRESTYGTYYWYRT
jgi:uncharacterized repeat protein (TIGR02543 family)